jgi:uncharacterized phage infection (PIP) family protein YhgE
MTSIEPIDDTLPALADSLEQCAQQIEETFTRVGDQLGDGLTLFETLNGSLRDLSGELASGDMDSTRDALRRLAGDLRAFGDGLPIETETLQDIATRNADATQSLGQLREHLQLIAILARSTRIEAASVQFNRGDLGDFTNKIVALTGQAKQTVDDCVRDHDRLTDLLGKTLAQQRDFVAQYRNSLSSVAGKLEQSVVGLRDRVAKSVAMTADAAAHAVKISTAVGGAIFSMQSGDSIRQRLEHSFFALRFADRAVTNGEFAEEDWSSGERTAIDLVLRRIHTVQLRQAALVLKGDVREIDAALAVLKGDTASLVGLGRSLFAGDDASSSRSFLEVLEAELGEASSLIQKCDAARDVVDRATAALTSSLNQFQQTVSGLSETIQDIVMIGTNAGLLAGRLGSEGRGLVVIAGEVKLVAAHIAKDASRLNPIFSSMQKASRDLQDRDRHGANDMAALDGALRRSLDQMRKSGSRLSATLERLARDGVEFGAVVGDSRLKFSNAAASGEVVGGVAEILERAQSADGFVSPADGDVVVEALSRYVLPTYTMAAEREIHHQVLGECGLSSASSAAAELAAAE